MGRAWTESLPGAQKDAFVDDVVDGYAEVIGSDHQLRFMQLRSTLRRPEASARTNQPRLRNGEPLQQAEPT